MENNNSYGAAFCQDSQVVPNGAPVFLLKKGCRKYSTGRNLHWFSLVCSAGGQCPARSKLGIALVE